jgi:protease-4
MDLHRFDLTHFLVALVVVVASFYATSLAFSGMNLAPDEKATVAKVKLDGPIVAGDGFRQEKVTPGAVEDAVRKARKEGEVDAFIFAINSPGGGVVPSKDVARAIADVEEPTVCLFKSVAASGAYWAGSECDHIVADSLTLTGSIGVNSAYLQFTGLMDKYGVRYVNLTAGEFKDAGSPFRNLTGEERELFQDQIDAVHKEFIREVAANRGMPEEEMEELATGETFLGKRAVELGLVDELGAEEDARAYLEQELGRNVTMKTYTTQRRPGLLSLLPVKIGRGIGQVFVEQMDARGIEKGYSAVLR